jgi:IS30 family transposase
MRNWTTKDVKLILEWAQSSESNRPPVDAIARQLNRTPDAVKEYIRRCLPRGARPWKEKPRWNPDEMVALDLGKQPDGRSAAAARKFLRRRERAVEEVHATLTATEVAASLGVSRMTIHRYVQRGLLRRFKDGIAESSFEGFLRSHPELVPYEKLKHEQKEWLVLNGFRDSSIKVQEPTVRGLLD